MSHFAALPSPYEPPAAPRGKAKAKAKSLGGRKHDLEKYSKSYTEFSHIPARALDLVFVTECVPDLANVCTFTLFQFVGLLGFV